MLRRLRSNPLIFALLLFIYFVLIPLYWIVSYQPVGGLPLDRDGVRVALASGVSAIVLLGVGWRTADVRELAGRFAQATIAKLIVALTSLGFTLVLIELAMRLWMVQPDGYGFTLMHEYWMERYWQPMNSMGYRDEEPQALTDATQILITGDSFVAGHGINDYRQTFPQELEELLGDGYTVNIAAHLGWGTDLELDAVDRYPITPDILILSYCFNDILTVAPAPALQLSDPQEPLKYLTRHFFLVDFLYWHVYQGIFQPPQASFTQALLDYYKSPDYWRNQVVWLGSVIENAQKSQARLIVITWPPLNALEAGYTANQQVVDFYRERGITVIDMGEILKGEKAQDLVVNAFDSHPNERVHQEAAEALYEVISRTDS